MIGLEFIVSDEEVEEGHEMKENMMADAEGLGHRADSFGHNSEPSEPSESGRSGRSGRSGASSTVKKSKAFTSFRINETNAKSSSKIVIPSFPLAFAAAVYIDSGMDGPPPSPLPRRQHAIQESSSHSSSFRWHCISDVPRMLRRKIAPRRAALRAAPRAAPLGPPETGRRGGRRRKRPRRRGPAAREAEAVVLSSRSERRAMKGVAGA